MSVYYCHLVDLMRSCRHHLKTFFSLSLLGFPKRWTTTGPPRTLSRAKPILNGRPNNPCNKGLLLKSTIHRDSKTNHLLLLYLPIHGVFCRKSIVFVSKINKTESSWSPSSLVVSNPNWKQYMLRIKDTKWYLKLFIVRQWIHNKSSSQMFILAFRRTPGGV